MMKAIPLLVIAAVIVTAAPTKHILKHTFNELVKALNRSLEDVMGDEIYVENLRVKGFFLDCKNDFFCQAEKVLVSVQNISNFRKETTLMRNLNKINQHFGETCTVDKNDTIPLYDFLEDLKKCVQQRNSKISH